MLLTLSILRKVHINRIMNDRKRLQAQEALQWGEEIAFSSLLAIVAYKKLWRHTAAIYSFLFPTPNTQLLEALSFSCFGTKGNAEISSVLSSDRGKQRIKIGFM